MSKKKKNSNEKGGLKFKRRFTQKGTSPYDMFDYETREAVIKDNKGKIIFRQTDVEVPKTWSQTSTSILAQKFFRKTGVPKNISKSGAENSIKQVVDRLVACWKSWGEKVNYFATKEDADIFYDELAYMLVGQYAAPNSPQWFNTGLYNSYGITGKPQGHFYVDEESGELYQSKSAYERPQPHACFILSVKDDLINENGIMDLWVREARIFKYGSGTGTNFSTIRGEGEELSGGGHSSGLMSFLKIGDRAAGAIKSGGTTRRAAKMVCLDIDHPEIKSFINWKTEEEKKVSALIKDGYSSEYEGEAYKTVAGQNSNNSVRVSNDFFNALDNSKKWKLKARKDGSTIETVDAQELWDLIVKNAWSCGDPGIQFDSTINEWHTCPKGGRINASNPCSEYMFLDNTACNLASLNLLRFFDTETSEFRLEDFEHACRLWTVVLEISVLMAHFPSKEVAQLSYDYRTLGLGYANLGAVLMCMGIPYDSEKGRAICSGLTSIMHGSAYGTSAEMAKHFGTFRHYEENRGDMLRVIRNHKYAANNKSELCEDLEIKPQGINPQYCPENMLNYSNKIWEETLTYGEKYGFRNAQVTVIAPTGTIGLLMDCDMTGIEPEFTLVKYKKLSGGGNLKILNTLVPQALKKLGYNNEEINEIENYVMGHGSLKGSPHISRSALLKLNFTSEEIDSLEHNLKNNFNISQAFATGNFTSSSLDRLGIDKAQQEAVDFDMLHYLGFSEQQIEEVNEFIYGAETIEEAPYLKEEHLAVFDCANKCGIKGKRFIRPEGHIKMMAAAQPFLSGSISKTINLPNEATLQDISDCYRLSWKLALKSNALYRDGCKLSQPLSAKESKSSSNTQALSKDKVMADIKQLMANSPKDTELIRELSNVVKKSLPHKRKGFTQKLSVPPYNLYLRTGEYENGDLGEIFLDIAKEGSALGALMNCFAKAVSIGLQYGVPLKEFTEKFKYTKFEPNGQVFGHENIKTTDSIIDIIFKVLAYEYLHETDFIPSYEKDNEKPIENKFTHNKESIKEKVTIQNNGDDTKYLTQKQGVNHSNQSDAPFCPACGHFMVRNGNCHKCLNCGTQGGCS